MKAKVHPLLKSEPVLGHNISVMVHCEGKLPHAAEGIELYRRYSWHAKYEDAMEKLECLERQHRILRKILYACGVWILILEALLLRSCS